MVCAASIQMNMCIDVCIETSEDRHTHMHLWFDKCFGILVLNVDGPVYTHVFDQNTAETSSVSGLFRVQSCV